MSSKILKALEEVLEEQKVDEVTADFVRAVINFECFDNSFRYKAFYRDQLDQAVDVQKK